jgi:hypothetical protein
VFHYFLGIQVTRTRDSLILYQENYASEILEKVGMIKCKLVQTPLVTLEKLSTNNGTSFSNEDATRYRGIMGGLQYLTLTCPDVSFAVNKAC